MATENTWIQHLKHEVKKRGITYAAAMQHADVKKLYHEKGHEKKHPHERKETKAYERKEHKIGIEKQEKY